MKKSKILIYSMILISIVLCIPSVIYLINNRTVDGFNAYYSYILTRPVNIINGLMNGIVVISLLLIFVLLYILLIKKQNEILKTTKETIIFIMIISFIFIMILPFLSSDIYYYIGDSWLLAKYGENPYYTTVADLQNEGINDEILNNTGYWKGTVSVYGPLWTSISRVLVSFSFGSVTIALFVFKFAAYLVHILNSYLFYKITKSKKYMLIYGLNPLILLHFLSNVHNDIYLIVFILLALYFLIRKKNVIFTIIFLALSVCVKYSTILLVPFILLYCFRDKSIPKRILFCLFGGLSTIAIVVLFYLPYYKDVTIFTNMLVQGDRYSQSILGVLMNYLPSNIYMIIGKIKFPIFALICIFLLIKILFSKKITLRETLRKYNLVMLIFIFIILTNFHEWYIPWLIVTLPWQNKYIRIFTISLMGSALIIPIRYFMVGSDPFLYGMWYSIEILVLSTIVLLNYIQEEKCKRRKNVTFSIN